MDPVYGGTILILVHDPVLRYFFFTGVRKDPMHARDNKDHIGKTPKRRGKRVDTMRSCAQGGVSVILFPSCHIKSTKKSFVPSTVRPS
jgi:hypothetical protein